MELRSPTLLLLSQESRQLLPIVASVTMNCGFLAALFQIVRGRGGIAYLRSIILKDNAATMDLGSLPRRRMYASLPKPMVRPIVFLGDSLTVAYEWGEAFHASRHPVLNRGIGGDTSLGVLARINDICQLEPRALFLMIGTNDPQMLAYSPRATARTCQQIIDVIGNKSPDTLIYLESVLPSRTPKFNAWSHRLNQYLMTLCDSKRVIYIDLRPHFTDVGGLKLALTYDGLHLSAEGYQMWHSLIQPTIDELQAEPPDSNKSQSVSA